MSEPRSRKTSLERGGFYAVCSNFTKKQPLAEGPPWHRRAARLPLRASGEVKAIGIPKGDRLAAEQGVRQEDVFINLVEVVRENWSFGNGIAQYAYAPPPHLAKR
jgi:hypothetical protein